LRSFLSSIAAGQRHIFGMMRSALILLPLLLITGCAAASAPRGGGQTDKTLAAPRVVNPDDVLLPDGYRIEAVATGLNFPTGVAFDNDGRPHVTESGYSYGEVWTTPRLMRVENNGQLNEVARGDHAPWNGLDFNPRDSAFYVAQGGEQEGGRIVRIAPDGKLTPLVESLPSLGDHHTNGPRIGPNGAIYFGQGTATNSGVVGEDDAQFGWLKRHPEFHDIPGREIKLAGENFTTRDVLTGGDQRITTGSFVPFGTATQPGQIIPGHVPCTGGIMRINPNGGDVQLVAWGMRNPFGLAFAPDGALFVTENSYDVRGSRPVWGTGDLLWRIDPKQPALWYGWPDFHGDQPLTRSDHFTAPGKPSPKFLLAEHPNPPPAPAAKFGVHASADGFDFSNSADRFGFAGQAFVAQFGDMSPTVGKVMAPVGFNVVRVDPTSGTIELFAVNKPRGDKTGPASLIGGGGLERPVACRFTRDGGALYLVDFGQVRMTERGPQPVQNTGTLWRITRTGGAR